MKTKLILLIMGAGVILASCTKYPPSSDRLLEDLAVITQYDTKVIFDSLKTYRMPVSIKKVTDKDTIDLNDATAQAILAQIEKNMNARGFSLVPAADTTANIAIQAVYYQNTTVYTYSYGYYGYYYYYPYYPYYPVYYSSYTTGMINIELLNMKEKDPANHRVPVCWNAYIRGLLTGSHTTAEITGTVDQAFIQTPQLVTNK
jgi:hypothetical protein